MFHSCNILLHGLVTILVYRSHSELQPIQSSSLLAKWSQICSDLSFLWGYYSLHCKLTLPRGWLASAWCSRILDSCQALCITSEWCAGCQPRMNSRRDATDSNGRRSNQRPSTHERLSFYAEVRRAPKLSSSWTMMDIDIPYCVLISRNGFFMPAMPWQQMFAFLVFAQCTC